MSETIQEVTEIVPKNDSGIKTRYQRIRSTVKAAVAQGLQSPRSKPSDIRVLRRGAFFAAEEEHKKYEKAREESMIDNLTGLPNRRWIEEQLEMRIAEEQRKNRPFRIAFIDLDHFKWVNDGYGHDKGDLVLQSIRALSTRKEEPVARYGGEEFLQILENGNESEGLEALTSRYMDTVELITSNILKKYSFKGTDPAQKLDRVTLSIGVADYRTGMNAKELTEMADSALYMAKKDRNQTVYAQYDKESDSYSFQRLSRVKSDKITPEVQTVNV